MHSNRNEFYLSKTVFFFSHLKTRIDINHFIHFTYCCKYIGKPSWLIKSEKRKLHISSLQFAFFFEPQICCIFSYHCQLFNNFSFNSIVIEYNLNVDSFRRRLQSSNLPFHSNGPKNFSKGIWPVESGLKP